MPLEETGDVCGFKDSAITVKQMRDGFVSVLRRVVADPQMKRVFGIAKHKVEYVGEMVAVSERHLRVRDECLADMERTLRQAARRGELSRRMPTRAAAIGLHALLDGLLQNWMLDPDGFDLVRVGTQVLDAYLSSLVVSQAPAAAT
jgi:TetR/AcrR family acrAB operon transcriptional repressor